MKCRAYTISEICVVYGSHDLLSLEICLVYWSHGLVSLQWNVVFILSLRYVWVTRVVVQCSVMEHRAYIISYICLGYVSRG